MRSRASVAVATTLLVLALAGCSGSVSTGGSVSASKLEGQVASAVGKKLDIEPPPTNCPHDLKGKKGATTTCTIGTGADATDVLVTVTKVEGSTVKFDVRLKGDPSGSTTTEPAETTTTADETTTTAAPDPGTVASVAPAELESKLSAGLEQQVGQAPDSATCPDALEGIVGATTHCTITDGADSYDVLLTVNSVNGTDVNFGFKVADVAN